MNRRITVSAGLVFVVSLYAFVGAEAAQTPSAAAMLKKVGVKGGLIVHLGCGDGKLTAELRASDSYLVHGLDSEARNIDKARRHMRDKGIYGPISVDLLEGTALPYVDNSVNLVVVENLSGVARQEVRRVLAPGGVACFQRDGKWTRRVKPRPDNIDEWTHYMHDPTNNAVAHDTAVGPPRHLQWEAAPQYSRHHEFTSSVAAVVSTQGRVFSIIDMGSRASIHMPPKWTLTARDAFNGIVLWERPIKSWFNHLWPLKDGPAQPPRRLVAVGDSVYVTLGFDAGVSRLDAATGKTLKTYRGTEFTEEIICSDDVLFLLKNIKPMSPDEYHPELMVCWDEKNRTMKESEGLLLTPEDRDIIALDAKSGDVLWKVTYPIEPLTLAVDDSKVFFHNWSRVVCLDRKTGEEVWLSEPVDVRKNMGYVYGPTLVAYDDVVLFADGRLKRRIRALSKEDGELLWQAPHYAGGHAGSAEDLMVIDGLVWCGKIAGGRDSGIFTGRDPKTGDVKREFTPDVETYWFHHRCYRSKATDKYFLASRTGIEFIDIHEKTWEPHHWVRGACTYGILPCNGLIYAPPSPCACYLESKLEGFCALAPTSQRLLNDAPPASQRLIKGPAYGHKLTSKASADQWPTYRHDAARSGATKAAVDMPLSERWHVNLGGELTGPVVVNGRVFTASKDSHTLYALSANDGKEIWTFTAGAEVDSPPTVYRGLVIFGSADGHVYCLRASDGELARRFRAAPWDMRLVSYGQLQSVWPVHGSVLVEKGIAHFVAGRSTYLDGGIRFYRLNAATGDVLFEDVLDDQQSPQKDVKVLNMPTALPDVLSSDGKMVYMRSQAFEMSGKKIQTIDPATEPVERATQQLGPGTHLFSPTGFLDSDAWHRSYWLYGRAFSSGCNWWYRAGRYAPAGRLLVYDAERVYGFGREPGLFVWSHVLENHLFCSAREADQASIERVKKWGNKSGRDAVFNREFTRHAEPEARTAPKLYWSVKQQPLHVRAMVLANDTLFIAGPPDVVDEDEAFKRPFDPKVIAKLVKQDAAYQGKHGAMLMAVSTKNGRQVSKIDLPAPPVWDGMAAAQGCLFICGQDGQLTCFGDK